MQHSPCYMWLLLYYEKMQESIEKHMKILNNTQITALCQLAKQAGDAIMAIYEDESALQVQQKADDSPVTAADLAAHNIIMARLPEITPDITIISEESAQKATVTNADTFWLVDPLDGTKSFIKRTGEFTVNLGLIHKAQPVAGIVYVPAQEVLYFTAADGKAYKQQGNADAVQIRCRRPDAEAGFDVVASQSHRTPETDDFIATHKVRSFVAAGSSLKFCLVAEGAADLYPRFGPTMEWDTAAAHAVLLAAGGTLTQPDGSAFLYAKPDLRNGHFIAGGLGV